MFTYVIKDTAMVNQKRAKDRIDPDSPEANRLHGASREEKKAMTVKKRPIR